MKLDRLLWYALLINFSLALIFRWAMWNKIVLGINGLALLVCVVRVLITGENRNG